MEKNLSLQQTQQKSKKFDYEKLEMNEKAGPESDNGANSPLR